jgi:hypothetical protein
MIVAKPIVVKIGKKSQSLVIGKSVPAEVLSYWKKTDQLNALVNAGAIIDEKVKVNEVKIEDSKKEKKKQV